ncbi:hypothetical protein AX14_000751 [Amanita brunnescens Koide BX004]|nr:hypothetical protein AX14_000751 [Amanita brunnescens Koide BX004]
MEDGAPSSTAMADATHTEPLPSFRTISQIAAGGRDDPTGELWRGNMRRDLPQPLVVPPAEVSLPAQSSSSSLPGPLHESHHGKATAERGPDTWTEREQVADIDYENSDTCSVSESSSDGGSDDASVSADSPSVNSSWESHVLKKRDDGNYVVYECRWTEDDNHVCGYTAKRQLVKRHVEDKHMGIKRYECPFCGRRFAQKSSCLTHQNSHTGAKPHPCFYKCGKWFSDPSKRTRHAYKVHGMNPKSRGVDNS